MWAGQAIPGQFWAGGSPAAASAVQCPSHVTTSRLILQRRAGSWPLEGESRGAPSLQHSSCVTMSLCRHLRDSSAATSEVSVPAILKRARIVCRLNASLTRGGTIEEGEWKEALVCMRAGCRRRRVSQWGPTGCGWGMCGCPAWQCPAQWATPWQGGELSWQLLLRCSSQR